MSKSKDRLLSVNEVAERLGTTVYFPRRLVAERRITFVRVGRHVRIPESVLEEFIERGHGGARASPPGAGGLMAAMPCRFGRVRKLPSGRWQARYPGADGLTAPAPSTFPTKRDAEVWLSVTESDLVQGTWFDPDAGLVPLGEYRGSVGP